MVQERTRCNHLARFYRVAFDPDSAVGRANSRMKPDRRTNCRVWIVGCGDIGRRILYLFNQRGTPVCALVSSTGSAEQCRRLKTSTVVADLDTCTPRDLEILDGVDVIYLVPPPSMGVTDPRIRRFLASVRGRMRRLILISTTGVYGDCNGEWIDETMPPNPATDRGRRRLDAEVAVSAWSQQTGGSYIILRVPGIYAEGRLPVERLRKGLPVVRQSEAPYTNRIHADDLAQICICTFESDKTGVVYNATDGHPTTMTEYFNCVADALDMQRPPQISLEKAETVLSPGMLSYMRESRKIGNRKLLEAFDIQLRYPNLDVTLRQVSRLNRVT